jgi:hypothetical protein
VVPPPDAPFTSVRSNSDCAGAERRGGDIPHRRNR